MTRVLDIESGSGSEVDRMMYMIFISSYTYSSSFSERMAPGMGRASQLFENGSDRKELSSFQESII